MTLVTLTQSQGTLRSCSSPISFLAFFTINFFQHRSSYSIDMVDGIVEVISKPEFLEVILTFIAILA